MNTAGKFSGNYGSGKGRRMKPKAKVAKVMDEFKRGSLRSGSKKGPKVKSRDQAVAIAMNESGQSRKKGGAGKTRKSARRMPEPASDASFGVR